MYVPPEYTFTDSAEQLAFMRAYPFVTLVTADTAGVPRATHVPVIIAETGDSWHIKTHLAKANPQQEDFTREVLLIFQEPHAYISPSLYERKLNVPTWNYVAVHLYGTVNILEAMTDKIALLEASMQSFEAEYLAQWATLPDAYKMALLDGIIALEIHPKRIEAKAKLSQNKTERDRENIIAHLSNSEQGTERDLANLMITHRK